MLMKPHTAHAIKLPRATSSAHSSRNAHFSWIGRKPCDRIRLFRSFRLRAQQDQGSLGPDEGRSFSDVELSDEEIYRRVIEELPTELADDIDPEEKELTLEDLMTAQGGIPASLRSELHSDDVWGPPVSSAPYTSAVCCSVEDQDGHTMAIDNTSVRSAMPENSCSIQCVAIYSKPCCDVSCGGVQAVVLAGFRAEEPAMVSSTALTTIT